MSQINYEAFQSQKSRSENQQNGPYVGYFSLKNDKDEAVVRFMHESPMDFDIVTVHPVTINNKYKKVNCIRDPKDPIENCPFCAAEKQIQQRFYIHLIEYVKQEDGSIKPEAKLWDRPVSYITTLKNLCDEYGVLSENVFKIKRNGVAGSFDTTYDIMYANPNIYKADIYQKKDELFENVKAVGTAVLDKSFEELVALLGSNDGQPGQPSSPVAPVAPQPAVQPQPMPNNQPQYAQVAQQAPTQDAGFGRPRRFF